MTNGFGHDPKTDSQPKAIPHHQAKKLPPYDAWNHYCRSSASQTAHQLKLNL